MKLTEFKPHGDLALFIDAYWEITCTEGNTSYNKVLPDGCVDIIINLGEDYFIESEKMVLKGDKAYLGGALTHFKEAKSSHKMRLIGVRFKPAGFSHFYSFSSLHEVTDQFAELPEGLFPDIKSLLNDVPLAFDSFFHNRLIEPKCILLPVVETVVKNHGNISVCARYRFARQLILRSYPFKSLADIAFDCGYYDQAHLGNELKKYTGVAPSISRMLPH